jgi:hypothetical protein
MRARAASSWTGSTVATIAFSSGAFDARTTRVSAARGDGAASMAASRMAKRIGGSSIESA